MKTKILFQFLTILSGACLGLSAGLILRQRAGIDPTSVIVGGASVTNRGGAGRPGAQRARNAPLDSSPLATQLAADLSKATGVTRWLYWWDAIEKAGPTDFLRLARLAQGNRVVTHLLAERWAQLGPQQLFETLRVTSKEGNKLPTEFGNVLFTEWLKRDRPGVISALNGAQDFPARHEWRQQVAVNLMETDPETGLKLMSEWHIDNYSPDMRAVRTWAAADPRHAAEFTLSNSSGSVARDVITEIGQVWANSAPGTALDFALSQRGDLASSLAQTVLKGWAERNLNEAADWLANTDPATLKKFSPAFVEAWAKQDAPAALAWCQSNLAGSTLSDAVGEVFNGAAQKDAAAAAELVSTMAPSPARSQAAAAVAEKWFPNTLDSKPVSAETLAWLRSLDPDAIRKAVDSISWRWTENDPSSMANFLQSTTNVSFQTYTYYNLARTMARNDPGAALDWTSRLPPGLSVSAGSSAFSEWGQAQPDAAMQWLSQLPAGDARHQPFFTGLVQQLAWDPQNYDRVAQIASTDPTGARSAIQSMSLPEDQRTALLAKLSPASTN